MINHKIFTKRQCRSSLLASAALLLGGALSFFSAVQAQETIVSVDIGHQINTNTTGGPSLAVQNSSTFAGTSIFIDNPSTLFSFGIATENRNVHNEFNFSYLYSKAELEATPSFSNFPRSYITPPTPFRRGSTDFFNIVKKATFTESGLNAEYRSYYSTELASAAGASLSAFGGFGVAAAYFNANTVYEASSGGTYAETNTTEFAIRATPLLGTALRYSFANGHYLRSNVGFSAGGLGYVSVENEVVKGEDVLIEGFEHHSLSDRSGISANISGSSAEAGIIYGTDQFEFTVGTKSFRTANTVKVHTNFSIGFKF